MLDVFDNLTSTHHIEIEFILREPLGSLVGALKQRKWKYYPLKYSFWSFVRPPEGEALAKDVLQNNQAMVEIEKIISKTKPDLVVTNTVICPWGALAAYNQKVPHVWFVREYGDLDHSRTFDLSHKETFEDIGKLSNLVVGNSETITNHIREFVDKKKVVTLYNPFNLEAIVKKARAKVQNPYHYPDSLKLVITSNLARTKGQLEAIEACGMLNHSGFLTEICVVGRQDDPGYQKDINGVIKKYDIGDKVHLLGLQQNALAYVGLSDVGVVASRMEAFGRVTFEYLALGKPVVGANSGATPEMVEDGKNGYLFEPQSAESLAKAAQHYAQNKSLIDKHGQQAAAKAKAMMKGKHSIGELYKQIEKVAAGRGEPKGDNIHYLKFWQERLSAAQNFKPTRPDVRFRLRQKAKTGYYLLRKVRAKVTGK